MYVSGRHSRRKQGVLVLVVSVALIIVTLFTVAAIKHWQPHATKNTKETRLDAVPQAEMWLSSDPVVVDGDSTFAPPTWTGSGTVNDPWTLNGVTINMTGLSGSCIQIRNTRDYFIIKNCTFIGGNSGFGIILSNVTNGLLLNNTVIGHTEYAIHLSWTESTNITLNLCEASYGGIKIISSSTDVLVNNNTIKDNFYCGVYLGASSQDNRIQSNSFFSNTVNALDDAITANNVFSSNYWSDYTGVDLAPRDAVGDTPHSIPGDADSYDSYPQMLPPTTAPIYWQEAPTGLVAQWGLDFACQLNVTAFAGIEGWWINDTIHFSIDSEGLLSNASHLAEGEVHGLQVLVTDIYNNALEGTFSIRILDTVPPEWIQEPTDCVLELGYLFRYNLNATDPSGLHIWKVNNTSDFSIDNNGTISNASNLVVGTYSIRVSVNDSYGHTLASTFSLTVQDTTPPSWVEIPMNRTLEFGDSILYDLNATDLSDISHWWIEGSSYFTIDEDGVLSNESSVPVGVYNLQVFVNDTQSQISSIPITLTIADTTSPIWAIQPEGTVLESGEVLDLQLEAWDLSGIYRWKLNDTTSFVVTSVGRIINLDVVSPGAYHLGISAYDPYDNVLQADIMILVQDTRPPEWTSFPATRTLEFGQGFERQARAVDPNGLDSWWLVDTDYFSIDTSGLIRNTTMLPVGTYQLQVRVNDSYGHTLSGSFNLTVRDTIPPFWITEPETQYVMVGEDLSYHLEAADLSGIDSWTINNTIQFQITSTGTIINTATLSLGEYHLLVIASDPYGNSLSEVITVVVVESDMSSLHLQALTLSIVALLSAGLVGTHLYLRKGRKT